MFDLGQICSRWGHLTPTKLGESDPVRPIIIHAHFFCWEVGGLDGFGPVFWGRLSDGLLRRPHRDGAMGASANNAAHPAKNQRHRNR